MKLLDMMTGAWALMPEKLLELQAIYATHLRGEKIDVEAIEARLGRPLASEQQAYDVRDGGVAVLTLEGVMAPKANLMMKVSGGVSTQLAMQQVDSMRKDPRVRSVVLSIDSPGGSVLGTPALAEAVRALADEKPTVTVGQGTLASAAYWVGSAANAVFVEGTTDQVGSIGVYARIGWEPAAPNTIEMSRGKYKRMAMNGQAPTPEAMAYHEAQLDHLYSVFVEAVADNRRTSADEVLQNMADGRVFIGQQAINAGLVDGVSTVEAMVERLAANPAQFSARRKAVFALGGLSSLSPLSPLSASAGAAPNDFTTPEQKGNVMPQADNPQVARESLERDHPSVFAQLREEFTAAATATGATAERERIQGVLAQGAQLPGHADLLNSLAFDGSTTPAQAALQLVAAEGQARQASASAHFADAPAAAKPSPAPKDEPPKTRAEQAAQAHAYAKEHGVDFVAACKAIGINS